MNDPIPLTESDPRWNLVQAYIDGVASAEEVAELEPELTGDPEFRAAYLRYLSLDSALEELIRRHVPKVRAMIFQMVLDHNTADDLTQETLLRAVRGIGAFEGRSESERGCTGLR